MKKFLKFSALGVCGGIILVIVGKRIKLYYDLAKLEMERETTALNRMDIDTDYMSNKEIHDEYVNSTFYVPDDLIYEESGKDNTLFSDY